MNKIMRILVIQDGQIEMEQEFRIDGKEVWVKTLSNQNKDDVCGDYFVLRNEVGWKYGDIVYLNKSGGFKNELEEMQ